MLRRITPFAASALIACSAAEQHDATTLDASAPTGRDAATDGRAALNGLDAGGDAIAADAADASDDGADDAGAIPDAMAPPPDAPSTLDGGCSGPLTTIQPASACAVVIQSWPDEGHLHVAEGTIVPYCTEPPNSGPHYPEWANYQTYASKVPDGYVVHSMEHGGVILRYQCASSCPDVASQLQAVVDAHPLDPMCDGTIKSRLILEPDPTLDVAVAASAWQWTYRATCVDTQTLTAFINAHYAQAAENTCAAGKSSGF